MTLEQNEGDERIRCDNLWEKSVPGGWGGAVCVARIESFQGDPGVVTRTVGLRQSGQGRKSGRR